ncbi:MAG: hypothetical protein AAF699_18000, partial [Pseudomonadota bacterium]
CWLLVAGCWLLVAGCWLLVAGCWLLVAGCKQDDPISWCQQVAQCSMGGLYIPMLLPDEFACFYFARFCLTYLNPLAQVAGT